MDNKKIIKIAGLNMGIALGDTLLFSPGFIGLQIGGANVLATAFGGTAILMSAVIFIYGNYKLITEEQKVIRASEIKTEEDYVNALKQNHVKKTFQADIDIILEQIERFGKKKETLIDILLQRFNNTEMSYKKFEGSILALENVFYANIRSILNKLDAFDQNDYERINKNDSYKTFSKEFIQTKMDIYNEYISFVKSAVEGNEEIILKLDKLLLEFSKLSSLETGEIENMQGMKEIDELIKQTKFYK